MTYRVAIVGATGLVGRTLLEILHERHFPVAALDLYASARSAGTTLAWKDHALPVQELTPSAANRHYDIAFFSAGAAIGRNYAPLFAEQGTIVIDNSSAWRADPSVPLVVPEVNGARAFTHKGIIANPNCSTIQLAVALAPIERLFGIERVVVATYQSVSGAGNRGLEQLRAELEGREPAVRIAPHPIAHNAVFHAIAADGWSEEERKVMTELCRILERPDIAVVATCVRLPFFRSHAEAVWVECRQCVDMEFLLAAYKQSPGVVLMEEDYPTPRRVADSDAVWIGRVRRDPSNPRAVALWVVADNIRKGAATNAVQIAELLHAGASPTQSATFAGTAS
ncbi:MAG: aspartate-semialdehyde dehydrogenase [Bacteroidota bacterium]|nr:aspartate-semialdehyde dehydrogenase [Candidatus Kapabacteria bacterium]MCX7936165.1 aspartate-semialdehyde dehydrogenase [Chlorobiota bacterium]MDW8074941.1 aspartate-semialdehyde dehydrogenase [Bacteroidota bacterium]